MHGTGIEIVTTVEAVRVNVGPRGGGRALVLCPACGRRCFRLYPSERAVVDPWEPSPKRFVVKVSHQPGFFEMPPLRLPPGEAVAWACRECAGTRGRDERAGRARRLRHLIETMRAHPQFGRRREGESWAREYRRRERLAKAEAELAEIERRQLEADLTMADRLGRLERLDNESSNTPTI